MAAPSGSSPKGDKSEFALEEDPANENVQEPQSGSETGPVVESQRTDEAETTCPLEKPSASVDVHQALSPENENQRSEEVAKTEEVGEVSEHEAKQNLPPTSPTVHLKSNTDQTEQLLSDEDIQQGTLDQNVQKETDDSRSSGHAIESEETKKLDPEISGLLGGFLGEEESFARTETTTDDRLSKPGESQEMGENQLASPEMLGESSPKESGDLRNKDLGDSEEKLQPVLEVGDLLGELLEEEAALPRTGPSESEKSQELESGLEVLEEGPLKEKGDFIDEDGERAEKPSSEFADLLGNFLDEEEAFPSTEERAVDLLSKLEKPQESVTGPEVLNDSTLKESGDLRDQGNVSSPERSDQQAPETEDLLGQFLDEAALLGTEVLTADSQSVHGKPQGAIEDQPTLQEVLGENLSEESGDLRGQSDVGVTEGSGQAATEIGDLLGEFLEEKESLPGIEPQRIGLQSESEAFQELNETQLTAPNLLTGNSLSKVADLQDQNSADNTEDGKKSSLELADLLGDFLEEEVPSRTVEEQQRLDQGLSELQTLDEKPHITVEATDDRSKDHKGEILAENVGEIVESYADLVSIAKSAIMDTAGENSSKMSEMTENSQVVSVCPEKVSGTENFGDHRTDLKENSAGKSDKENEKDTLEGWLQDSQTGNEVEKENEETKIELLQGVPVYTDKLSDERTTEAKKDLSLLGAKELTESCIALVHLEGTDQDEKQLLISNENKRQVAAEIKLSEDLMQLEDPFRSGQDLQSQAPTLCKPSSENIGTDSENRPRLEETVRGEDDEKITTPATSSHVSAQIRQIVTKHLSTEDLTEVGTSKHQVQILKDENQTLQRELDRIEDLLATTRAEREEILIKYNALSERLDQLLQHHGGETVIDEDVTVKTLLNQNMELRRRLEEERANFMKKVQTYHDGQRQQANLVQRLQSKVIQYKQKCSDLETSIVSQQNEIDQSRTKSDLLPSGGLDIFDSHLSTSLNGQIVDLDAALIKVEYEQNRSANLIQVNSLLREQLEAATQANHSLAADIQALTQDWQKMREELELKENEWREEEQSFNDYFMSEHNRLLSLWRDTVKFRREFGDMKSSTEKDLAKLRSDLKTIANELKVAYLNLQPSASFNVPLQQELIDHSLPSSIMGVEGNASLTPTELWHRIQDLGKAQAEALLERSELLSRIEEIKAQNDQLRSKLDEKERHIKSLAENVQTIESIKESSETHISTISSLREENTILHNTLKDIAKRVLWGSDQDRDRDDIEGPQGFTAVGMSGGIFGGSPSVDLTISSIQNALGKRQVEVEELTSKLEMTKNQLIASQKQYDDCIEHRKQLEKQMQQLKSQLESSLREKNDLLRDSERTKLKLESLDNEKEQLDRVRQSLASQVAELNSENENLQREMLELQKNQDGMHEEQENLRLEKDKRKKEMEISQKNISMLETKLTSVKEELLITKESLSKFVLSKDALQQEKSELENAVKQAEKRCRILEIESSKLRAAESSLRDILAKLHGDSEVLGLEKAELASYVKKLTEDKVSLSAELAEADQEKAGLREEVLRLEQEKMVLTEEKTVLQEALSTAERNQEALQNESDHHARELRELSSQLATESRKKAALADEAFRLTQETEHRAESMEVARKEKERLTKEKADLAVRLETSEREIRSLSENLATLKADKGSLEMSLYETQQALALMLAKKEQLERERDDLMDRRQSLQAQVNQLQKDYEKEILQREAMKKSFEKRLTTASEESASKLGQTHTLHKEEIERLIREKETMKQRLESSHQDAIAKLIAEQQQVSTKSEGKLEAAHRQIESLQREMFDKLSVIEREKEKVTTMARKEKAKLQERIQFLQQDLQKTQALIDKERRDATARSEQDKTAMADLQLQLRNLKSQLEDSGVTFEKTLKDLRNEIQEGHHQRSLTQQEMSTLRGKLKVAEEGKENLKKELIETLRKLSDADSTAERLENEIADLKQQLNEEKHEKGMSLKSNEDLIGKLKRLEGEKSDLKRSLEESQQQLTVLESSGASSSQEIGQLRQTLQEVEKSRLELRKEAQNLRKHTKLLEESLQKKALEISEIQGRLSREEDKDENNRREIFAIKQQLTESEAAREILRKDMANLQRQLSKMEDVHLIKERDLRMALQENRDKVQQLEDRRRHLEGMLTSVTSESDELKLQLSTAEGKLGALESQLLKLEGAKKDVEHKLTTIYSALRRYVGLRTDGMTSPAGFLSPVKRRRSPIRGIDGATVGDRSRLPILERVQSAADVNPEVVRGVLRDVMQQLITLEKEKDDAVSQVHQLKEQIADVENERDRTREKISQIQNSLGASQHASQNVASQLTSAQQTIVTQQETINKLQKDSKATVEAISNYEHRIKLVETENSQNMEKLKKVLQNETRLERENAKLKEMMVQMENRTSSGDQARRSLEAELQRLRMNMTDKDTEHQVLQARCETLTKQVQELEEKSVSLQITIDRLNLALERSAEDESELKDKLQSLNKSLTESASSGWSLQEKIHHLQKTLANSENERRVYQERCESAKQSLNESKKTNLALSERIQQLRQELSNIEDKCKDYEGQLRSSEKFIGQLKDNDQENLQHIQRLQQEKHSLQATIAELQRSLTQLEVEKHDIQRWQILLEKDKSALKQTLDKVERERLLSTELASRTNRERSALDRTFHSLEKENEDLQRRLQTFEVQLAEQEKHHSQQLLNLSSRHRQERDMEIERLKNAHDQAQKTLELRERSHRQRVIGLEQQIQLLKDQLNQEIRKRQLYIQRSAQAGDEMKDLRKALDRSLKNVSRDPTVDTLLLERETQKLDNAVDRHLGLSSPSSALRVRSRTISPVRPNITSTPQTRASILASRGLTGSLQRL